MFIYFLGRLAGVGSRLWKISSRNTANQLETFEVLDSRTPKSLSRKLGSRSLGAKKIASRFPKSQKSQNQNDQESTTRRPNLVGKETEIQNFKCSVNVGTAATPRRSDRVSI